MFCDCRDEEILILCPKSKSLVINSQVYYQDYTWMSPTNIVLSSVAPTCPDLPDNSFEDLTGWNVNCAIINVQMHFILFAYTCKWTIWNVMVNCMRTSCLHNCTFISLGHSKLIHCFPFHGSQKAWVIEGGYIFVTHFPETIHWQMFQIMCTKVNIALVMTKE